MSEKERVDGGGNPHLQLVIDEPEWEEHDDGTRTLVDGELSHLEYMSEGKDDD